MKKIVVSISFILFVSATIINAQVATTVEKKTATEVKMKCAKCPQAKGCAMMADSKTPDTKMSTAKCKEMGSDTTKCKAKCDKGTTSQNKECDPAKCKMMSKK